MTQSPPSPARPGAAAWAVSHRTGLHRHASIQLTLAPGFREAGLVGSERRGTWVYYWVLPEALAKLSALLEIPAVPVKAGT